MKNEERATLSKSMQSGSENAFLKFFNGFILQIKEFFVFFN